MFMGVVLCFVIAVAGLSRQQMVVLQGSNPSSGSDAPRPDNPAYAHSISSRSLAGASARGGGGSSHASLLRSLPVAVLADPSPSRPQAGVVLSVAPLLGARPYTDPQVGKWLHVHVRPSVRGLLRIIKVCGVEGWGHWGIAVQLHSVNAAEATHLGICQSQMA